MLVAARDRNLDLAISSLPARADARFVASPCPPGVIAVLLAILIAAGAGWGACVWARRLAEHSVRALAGREVRFKYQTLTLQRAALASGEILPIYGSSELRCCGSPYLPTELFASMPTGFGALALGHAGTANLFFMQTFAALGDELRGKKVAISESPSWFRKPRGLSHREYAGNFSAEVVYAFVFDAPISRELREAGARRMLAYPETLEDQPLLRLAVEDLAHPTPLRRVEYALLTPLGRIATSVLGVRDGLRTLVYAWRKRSAATDTPRDIDWPRLAERGTRMAEQADTTNPFGFPDATYREMARRPEYRPVLERRETGQNNREGGLLPPATGWEHGMSRSAEWKSLHLALRVLREVGARPLVWSLPMPGVYDDYTRLSEPTRRRYYARYERVAGRADVPWLDFADHDEDRWFLSDPGSHPSPRGWVFADRALDLFWHDRSADEIRTALAALDREAPPP
jgi:D-alanine transfer protein